MNLDRLRSPQTIFFLYIVAAGLLLMVYHALFPGEQAPLPIFTQTWRLFQFVLDFFALFPALVLSALVVPFGITEYESDYYSSFSPIFFQRLVIPIILAMFAAGVYAVIFFLALPLSRQTVENMRSEGELYQLAKYRAQTHADAGEWLLAQQFLGVCERVWPASPELTALKNETAVRVFELQHAEGERRAAARAALTLNPRGEGGENADVSALPGQRQPVDATEAMAMAEAALAEGRLYDAHWLATLGQRIARQGSPEAAEAQRLASRAWNQIETQQPNRLENRLSALYRLKRSGYEAMLSGEWIRAFYIFQELLALTPDDPDAAHYLAACEKGTAEQAFFIDELEISAGGILTGAIFSLPAATPEGLSGRTVMRISGLSVYPDYAYGIGLELFNFDAASRPLLRLQAPYAKILPFTVEGRHKTLLLMRALDRRNENLRWEPEAVIEGNAGYRSGDAQITLDISYETFIMLSQVRQGPGNMDLQELFSTSALIGVFGYVPQVFEAEILNRLGTVLFFLPVAILTIIAGWRFRVRKRARWFFVLFLPVLPAALNGIFHLYRTVLNTGGIWLALSFGFSTALAALITAAAGLLIFSLIFLASQHN